MKTVKTKDYNFTFSYPEGLEHEIHDQVTEIFEKEVYKEGIKKNGIYMDVGANVGNATRYFSKYAKKIYAIEPNPEIYEHLVKNTKDLKNVETFNFALSSHDGSDYMFSNQGGSIPQSLWGDNDSVNSVKVEMKSPKTFMAENNINHIDVMKMDTEGSEYVVFPSASFEEVADKIDLIIGESHFMNSGAFPDVIPAILKDYGFKTKFLKGKYKNYLRYFAFTDFLSGKTKRWSVPYHTMFLATK